MTIWLSPKTCDRYGGGSRRLQAPDTSLRSKLALVTGLSLMAAVLPPPPGVSLENALQFIKGGTQLTPECRQRLDNCGHTRHRPAYFPPGSARPGSRDRPADSARMGQTWRDC